MEISLSQVAEFCYDDQLFSSPQDNRLANFIVKEFSDQADPPLRNIQTIFPFGLMVSGMPYFSLLKGEKLALSGEKASLVYDVVNIKVDPR